MIASMPKRLEFLFALQTQTTTKAPLATRPSRRFTHNKISPISAVTGTTSFLSLRHPIHFVSHKVQFILEQQRFYLHNSIMESMKPEGKFEDANALFEAIENKFPPNSAGKEAWFLVTVRHNPPPEYLLSLIIRLACSLNWR